MLTLATILLSGCQLFRPAPAETPEPVVNHEAIRKAPPSADCSDPELWAVENYQQGDSAECVLLYWSRFSANMMRLSSKERQSWQDTEGDTLSSELAKALAMVVPTENYATRLRGQKLLRRLQPELPAPLQNFTHALITFNQVTLEQDSEIKLIREANQDTQQKLALLKVKLDALTEIERSISERQNVQVP